MHSWTLLTTQLLGGLPEMQRLLVVDAYRMPTHTLTAVALANMASHGLNIARCSIPRMVSGDSRPMSSRLALL